MIATVSDIGIQNLFVNGAQIGIASDLLRYISILLDLLVYSLIPAAFGMIEGLYSLPDTITKSDVLDTVSKSIYSFLAIFMFFRVAFSLLGMLVDPGMISDKEKGAGKLVSGIFICLVLIVAVPGIFKYAMKAQEIIMTKGVIEKAVYGDKYEKLENSNLGKEFSLAVLQMFIAPTVEEGGAVDVYKQIFVDRTSDLGVDGLLLKSINYEAKSPYKESETFWRHLVDFLELCSPLSASVAINMENNPDLGYDNSLLGSDNVYQLSYMIVISTIAGAFVLWSFVKMCIDVAYRAIKLYFLQLISPIAIISSIDPKSMKNGMFSKWLAETVKTYLSLFIRLFVFAICSIVLGEIKLAGLGNGFIERMIFLLAIMAFLKSAPKFIDGIFGTELSKDSESKFGADLLKQGLGGLGMAAVGGITGLATAKKLGYNGGRGFWEGTKAGFTGGIEAVNKKDALGVITGLAKAGNGANAMRKYYGLPTAAESRKQKAEADLAMESAKKFSEVKNEVQKKKFDKMNDEEFGKYITSAANVPPGSADEIWKDAWTSAKDDVERDKVKRDYTNAKFAEAYGDIKEYRTLSKLSSNRSAKYRASLGTVAAIGATFDKDSEIGKHWLEEEKWSRLKIIHEQSAEFWAARREDAKTSTLSHGTGTIFSNDDGTDYFNTLEEIGISEVAPPAGGGAPTYIYTDASGVVTPYTSKFAAIAAAGHSGIREFNEDDLRKRAEKASADAGYDGSKQEEEKVAKEDRMKNPQNARDARDARKAQLIEAGKKRGG